MRELTTKEFNEVRKIINNTEWVHDMVNQELSNGKTWDLVMWQVAKAFKIV